jgi:homoserine dehydrogenase
MLADVSSLDPRSVTTVATGTRIVRAGLLGLGNVGQAVARLAPDAHGLQASGVRFRIAGALVRDVSRPRRCPPPARLTTNPEAFLRGHYDVVIEALGTIDPAKTIVARLLGRGIPVVTANKALVAAHGTELAALAARRGTSLRYEASALAGVPFLGALGERPYVADVSRFVAVVNGTSNFMLSAIDVEGCSFHDAFARAQRLGFTEPDPSRDLDGLDAADKFTLLASIFGWGRYSHDEVEVRGIREIGADDMAAAGQLGGTIKPVVWASRSPAAVEAFVGPAFVASSNPLASLGGTLSGIQFTGRYVSDLFFSGPGAGPEVTAATILDDAVEAVCTTRRFPKPARRSASTVPLVAPTTDWIVRVRFPGVAPESSAARALLTNTGLAVTGASDTRGGAQWLRVATASNADLTRALTQLRQTHRLDTFALRAL